MGRIVDACLVLLLLEASASAQPHAPPTARFEPVPEPAAPVSTPPAAPTYAPPVYATTPYAPPAYRPGTYPGPAPVWVRTAPAPIDRRARVERRWYGWQTLATDGAAILLVFAAIERQSAELASIGVGTYAFGGPIVHASRGHEGKAVGSFALRVGPPVAALLLALSTARGSDDARSDDRADVALVVFGLSIPAAIAIDAAVIAREEAPVRQSVRVTPALVLGPQSVGAGVGGAF